LLVPEELRLVMLGAPGAGKGTQAKRVATAYGLPHISTGDMFRAEVEADTELGRRVRQVLEEGQLVPDNVTVRMLESRLAEADARDGFVLDGFPRSQPQARMLDDLLAGQGARIDVALDLDVPDDEIVDRLTARRVCPECGAIYNMKFSPPREDEVCDNRARHGTVKLVRRPDDTEPVVRQRLEVYHEATEPVMAHYREAGVLESVNGSGASPDEVFERIKGILGREGAASAQ
jgi:adenylate kinase